jgi:hypothetical protein
MVNRNNLSKRNSNNRQFNKRQSRKLRVQKGGNNVEVSIYINLKEKHSEEVLSRPLTQSEKWDVETWVFEEFIGNSKDPKNSTQDIANLLNSVTQQSIDQLPAPYKHYHFLFKLTLPKTETHKFLDKKFLESFMEGLAADYISFEYGTDYSGNLLSNDKNVYFFSHDDYEIVGAGSPSVAAASSASAHVPTLAPVRASVSRKAPTPAQLRRASAKAAGVKYVPTKSPYVPLGCVQKDYVITNKLGTTYSTSRCLDSKDPAVNDVLNCVVNPETNKCKRVNRK